MKKLIWLLLLFPCGFSFARQSYTDAQIQEKCDSVLREADLLYRYARSAWITADAGLSLRKVKKTMRDFLVYESGDTLRCLIVDEKPRCIYEAWLLGPNAIAASSMERRKLTPEEARLAKVKEKALFSIANMGYKMQSYEDYTMNPILVPDGDGYKMYLVSGTTLPLTIPMGNDYLFYTDSEGRVTSWKQFHSRLYPVKILQNVSTPVHKHDAAEPFISATDICTFRMYSDKTILTEFVVYSPALALFFTYHKDTNTISVSDKMPDTMNER